MKRKVKSMLFVGKEFVLADQTLILLTAMTFYDDCMKMHKGFSLNLGDRRTGCSITTTHRLALSFNQSSIYQKQHDCHSPPTLLA
jgi:hypothetical protein